MCVRKRGWITEEDFEDAIAACNLLPGPASTQLALYCASRLRGRLGALIGGVAFIVPGLVLIIGLAAVFLASSPPRWVLGAGAGAGAAVAAVALQAGWSLAPASWGRAKTRGRARWVIYLAAGGAAAATLGPWLVLVLLACGGIELAVQRDVFAGRAGGFIPFPLFAVAVGASGGLLSLAWVGFKVGALSYGGGFVIIPLMQADAVTHYHWMTSGQFLNAVALGQITPGPVVQTVAVVGYAAAGIGGALLAALVAFSPSFAFILLGADRFDLIRRDQRARLACGAVGSPYVDRLLALSLWAQLTAPTATELACLSRFQRSHPHPCRRSRPLASRRSTVASHDSSCAQTLIPQS